MAIGFLSVLCDDIRPKLKMHPGYGVHVSLVEKECEKIGYREKGDSHEGEQSGQASGNDVESRASD